MRVRNSKGSDPIQLDTDIISDVLSIRGAQIRVGLIGMGFIKILRNELAESRWRPGISGRARGLLTLKRPG